MDKVSVERLRRTAAGRQVITYPVTEYKNTCAYCGGLGTVYYSVLGAAKLSHPPSDISMVYIDGYYRVVEESLGLPCAHCSDASAYYERRQNRLWENSGLLATER